VFQTTATIVTVLQGGGAASMNCGTDVVTVTTGLGTAPAGATLNATEFAAVNTRVGEMNTFLSGLATARGWAFFDVAALFNDPTLLTQIPAFPNFTNPSMLFGTLFSLDGVHPTAAGQRLLAQGWAAAINATYGSTLAIP
jgi:phospholipase/lecithinase/hemolysin